MSGNNIAVMLLAATQVLLYTEKLEKWQKNTLRRISA